MGPERPINKKGFLNRSPFGCENESAVSDFQHNLRDRNRIGVEFVLTDLDVGLTFLDVAAVSTSAETVRRNHENARKAYDAIVLLLKSLKPKEEDRSAIEEKLALLKARLEAVGYGVWVP